MKVICDYCERPASLVTGSAIYPHRPDLFHKSFWRCASCEAYVGCHPKARAGGAGLGDGSRPLGRLANAELRAAKRRAHAAFDPIWKSGEMRRGDAYCWLSKVLGISKEKCHIGMFDVDGCEAVVTAVAARKLEAAS